MTEHSVWRISLAHKIAPALLLTQGQSVFRLWLGSVRGERLELGLLTLLCLLVLVLLLHLFEQL
ncbi:hypothetical protein F7734_54160 [Scytonema sp. UIC 10036]|uniref:hypothetical protein n=1 Tax=Scytonema sp. UIC 10036 TaxID=2304196 RepID=UPI0012DAA239|nr:hypothetical protein [Scytonema sp. UIC 10036]MUH00748.1 hypothetical protein [Scytonema sp. UIC 10036]